MGTISSVRTGAKSPLTGRARRMVVSGQKARWRSSDAWKPPVLLEFNGEPLSAVIDYLSKLAEVNVYLDPQGLQQEAVTTDMPVSITLSQEVTLKSALKLILEPLHLSYVIEDEVLKITSEQMRSGDTYIETYNVADLVIPIPNFTPSNNQGLAGAYNDAMRRVSFNGGGGFGGGLMGSPLAVMANRTGAKASAGIDPNILAQMTGSGGGMGGAGMPQTMPMGMGGPGGAGGASMADFDSLISLITATVQPESWEDVGGPGTVAPFETNLSLVIRPDGRGPRRDRRSARTAPTYAGPAGYDRSSVHHPQRQLLRAYRRRLRLRHRRRHRPAVPGVRPGHGRPRR